MFNILHKKLKNKNDKNTPITKQKKAMKIECEAYIEYRGYISTKESWFTVDIGLTPIDMRLQPLDITLRFRYILLKQNEKAPRYITVSRSFHLMNNEY